MIIVTAPNCGSFMGRGGGSRVACAMAEAFLGSQREVFLVAFKGLGLPILDNLHGTSLCSYQKRGLLHLRYVLETSGIHLPYPVAVQLVAREIASLASKRKIELVVYHDDLVRSVFHLRSVKHVVYCHFPYAARILLNIADPGETEMSHGYLLRERIARMLAKKAIHLRMPDSVSLVANSTVTSRVVRKIWERPCHILFPPIAGCENPECRKEDLILTIGEIQPNKRFGEIIDAIALTNKVKLCIVGFLGQKRYLAWLESKIRNVGLQERVRIATDLSRSELKMLLCRAKAIVHCARFEPFGMAVGEAMAYGCIPIVPRGDLSGPWIDIVRFGRYGIGYSSTEELAKSVEFALEPDNFAEYSALAKTGVRHLETGEFERNLLRIVGLK